jgi:hypothetical protein
MKVTVSRTEVGGYCAESLQKKSDEKRVGRFAGLKVKRFGGQKRLAKTSPTLANPARMGHPSLKTQKPHPETRRDAAPRGSFRN